MSVKNVRSPRLLRLAILIVLLLSTLGWGGGPAAVGAGGSNAGVGYLAIPAAAFHSATYNYNYQNHGRYIMKLADGYVSHRYIAAVNLPDGAVVTSISFHFYDDSLAKNASAKLYRNDASQAAQEMASGATISNSGHVQAVDDSIDDPVIDNDTSVYWIETILPESTGAGGDVWGCSAFITYLRPVTQNGVVAIPGAAFSPYEDGYKYSAVGSAIFHYEDPAGGSDSGGYQAAVDLPQGAVVQSLSIQYDDGKAGAAASAWLSRADQAGNYTGLASVSSVDGEGEQTTTAISNATIDNELYRYWVYLNLPQTVPGVDHLGVYRVKIEYTTVPPSWATALSNGGMVGFDNGYDFENHGRFLFHAHSEGGGSDSGTYVAPVYLPHGAIVDDFTAIIYDGSSTLSGSAHLIRTRAGVNQELSAVTSSGSLGLYSITDNSIAYEKVDNSYYSYYVYWNLPVSTPPEPAGSGDVVGYSMRIRVKFPTFLPLILR